MFNIFFVEPAASSKSNPIAWGWAENLFKQIATPLTTFD